MLEPICPPGVALFSATDPSCGAGMQADVLTTAALGCHPVSIVTGLTAQDTSGMFSFFPLDPYFVSLQAKYVLADIAVETAKIGVVGTMEVAAMVADVFSEDPDIDLVWDPVLASTRGDPFVDDKLLQFLLQRYLPMSAVVTPNLQEARVMAGCDQADECAQVLLEAGARYVLITGGDDVSAETNTVTNRLYALGMDCIESHWPRLPGQFHGSGCTLSSAIASFLARGYPMLEAVRAAEHYTYQTLANGIAPGNGQKIPLRFLANALSHDFSSLH